MNNKRLHTFIQQTLNDCVFGEKDFIRTSELEQLCSANGKNADSLYKDIEELIKHLIYFKKAKEKKDFGYQAKLRPRIYSISRKLEVPEQIITEIFQKIRGTEVSSIIIDYQVDKSVEKGKGEKDEGIKQQSADKDKILFPKEKVKYSNQTSNDSSRRKNEEEDKGEKRPRQVKEEKQGQRQLVEKSEIKYKQYLDNANKAKSFGAALVYLQKIPKESKYYNTATQKISDIHVALGKQEENRQHDQTLLDAKTKIEQKDKGSAKTLLLSIPKEAKSYREAQTLLMGLGKTMPAKEESKRESNTESKPKKKLWTWIILGGIAICVIGVFLLPESKDPSLDSVGTVEIVDSIEENKEEEANRKLEELVEKERQQDSLKRDQEERKAKAEKQRLIEQKKREKKRIAEEEVNQQAKEEQEELKAKAEKQRLIEQKKREEKRIAEEKAKQQRMMEYNKLLDKCKNMIKVGGCESCAKSPACKNMVIKKLKKALEFNPKGTEAKKMLDCLTN